MRILFVVFALVVLNANAWMEKYAPALETEKVEVESLSERSVRRFVKESRDESPDVYACYSRGGRVDLNGDGIKDFVFIIPWMGCGLNASLEEVCFVVSNGAGGWMENVLEGYGVEMSDLVKLGGKVYFRHSMHFGEFEKSKHNHWVHQIFTFGTNGVMRCANADIGAPFPAATIHYENPKFKSISLTVADLKQIADETKPVVHPRKEK